MVNHTLGHYATHVGVGNSQPLNIQIQPKPFKYKNFVDWYEGHKEGLYLCLIEEIARKAFLAGRMTREEKYD